MSVTPTIRVVIADDHAIVRDGLRLILETSERIEVVGEAGDGKEALRQVAALHPNVVLMDLRMPELDGIEALQRVAEEHPDVAVIILTTYNEDDLMLRALRAGARGYLLKDTDRATLIDTVEAAARGEALLKPEILQRVLAHRSSPRSSPVSAETGLAVLTERELEVLRAASTGAPSKDIARRLAISERTVKAHLTSVYTKLGVETRAAAVAAAARAGWL